MNMTPLEINKKIAEIRGGIKVFGRKRNEIN